MRTAKAQPDETVHQSRTVGGWRIEAVSEHDGGRQVRMLRQRPGYSLSFFASFWRGNGGPVGGATVRIGERRSGDADGIEDPAAPFTQASLRERFEACFRECEALPTAAAAENEAIANYGREQPSQ